MTIEVIPDDRPDPCLHGYSETSARAKLARHRSRGDHSQRAWLCPRCGQWHVENAADWPPYLTGQGCIHLWGTAGRDGEMSPRLSDQCHRCGRTYGSLGGPSAHEVDPALEPKEANDE